ncbi:hypothetical protein [Ensifer aridi]|uniref:hypothetical protein n=1 Tax=Ensifer aridi TaxID=1708715 RepID=UPI000411C400
MTRAGRTSVLAPSTGIHSVGGSADCDLVIVGLEPEPAFRLEIWKDDGRAHAAIEATRHGVKLGTRDLPQGERIPLSNGATIRIADVECLVEGLSQDSRPTARLSRRRLAAAGLLALAALLLTAGFNLEDAPKPTLGTTFSRAAADPRPTASSIAAELREATRRAGLDLSAEVTPDGTEILVGENASPLDLASQRRLVSILASVARRSPVPVVDRTNLASGLDGFVAAAGYAPVKFIVGRDGRRYREGDAISGEWRIQEIRPGQLVVAYGDKTDTVSFELAEPDLRLNLADSRDRRGM